MILYFFILTSLINLEIPPDPKEPEAWVLIVDPGQEVFTRFGHSAFLIRIPNKIPMVYDYGNFTYNSKFIWEFISGRAKYFIDRSDLDEFMAPYEQEKRSIRGHKLNISPKKVMELRKILETRLNSDEKFYIYDHFKNNCATQMLFALSRLFKGDVEDSLEKIPIIPWRENLGTVLGETSPLYWLLKLALSSELDTMRNAWDGSFLPLLLEKALFSIQVKETPFAKEKPLIVKSVLFSKGVKHTNSPPIWLFIILIIYILFLLSPFLLPGKIWLFKINIILFSIFSVFLFSILLFLHFHLRICAYNLNMLAFFPSLFIFIPWFGIKKIASSRTVYLIVISSLFPLLEIFLKVFTIQKTSPFPEITFLIHLIFIGQWMLIYKKNSGTNEDLADGKV